MHIRNRALDANFHGYCLHRINLVICHSSQIQVILNMMDSCQQTLRFFTQFAQEAALAEINIIINCFCLSQELR